MQHPPVGLSSECADFHRRACLADATGAYQQQSPIVRALVQRKKQLVRMGWRRRIWRNERKGVLLQKGPEAGETVEISFVVEDCVGFQPQPPVCEVGIAVELCPQILPVHNFNPTNWWPQVSRVYS